VSKRNNVLPKLLLNLPNVLRLLSNFAKHSSSYRSLLHNNSAAVYPKTSQTTL
jgi:hypothetical protein